MLWWNRQIRESKLDCVIIFTPTSLSAHFQTETFKEWHFGAVKKLNSQLKASHLKSEKNKEIMARSCGFWHHGLFLTFYHIGSAFSNLSVKRRREIDSVQQCERYERKLLWVHLNLFEKNYYSLSYCKYSVNFPGRYDRIETYVSSHPEISLETFGLWARWGRYCWYSS